MHCALGGLQKCGAAGQPGCGTLAGRFRMQTACWRKQGRAACGEKNGGRHDEMGTSIHADLGRVWARGACCPGAATRGRTDRRGSAGGHACDRFAFRQGDRSGHRAMRKHDWPRVLVRAAPDHTDDRHPKVATANTHLLVLIAFLLRRGETGPRPCCTPPGLGSNSSANPAAPTGRPGRLQ